MSPISHENRRRYPADWPEIRERILRRIADTEYQPALEGLA